MKFINRFAASVLVSAICLTTLFVSPAVAAEDPAIASDNRYNMTIQSNTLDNWPLGPQVYAESAIVMEAGTGTILYSKNIDEQLYPASITKIMTVLLALENLDMDEEVTFSHNAVYSIDYDSSHIARDEGEILTVEESLNTIMLETANQCSKNNAEHNSPTEELGCTNTNFTNANGLPDENHYTSAHDMALITREAIKYEKFRQISGTPRYTLRATNKKSDELLMNNHHYMISNYKTSKYLDDTVFAGKTGYTTVALNTLVTCATRNGMDLIVVTMKTQGTGEKGVPIYTDTASLLNYATENFHKVNVAENETNFTLGQNDLFDTGSSIFGNTSPIIEMDNVIATLDYSYAGQPVGSACLTLSENQLQEFNFQKTDTGDETDAQETTASGNNSIVENKPTLVKINLRIVGIVAGILLILLILVILGMKFSKDYMLDMSLMRRWNRRR